MPATAQDWYQLEFAVARSLRYTAKRRAFFERCNQVVRAITAIAGAGTVAAIFHAGFGTAVFGGLIGLAAAIDLVFEFSKRSMTYDHLYRCYADLSIDIAQSERKETDFKLFQVRMLQIEKDEPTTLDVLNVICSNDVLEAKGHNFRYKVRFWQKLFSQIGDFGKQEFPRIPATVETPATPP